MLALNARFQRGFAACVALAAVGALVTPAMLGRIQSVPEVDMSKPIPGRLNVQRLHPPPRQFAGPAAVRSRIAGETGLMYSR